MSQGEHIKIFDPPLEKLYGDRGIYVHAIDDISTEEDSTFRMAAAFVGYSIQHCSIYQYPTPEAQDSEYDDEDEDSDDGSQTNEDPEEKFLVLPLNQQISNPEALDSFKFRGIASVIHLMVYAGGERLMDTYRFHIPDEAEENDSDNVEETPDKPDVTMEDLEEQRAALVTLGTIMLRQHLQNSEITKQRPEAA